MKYILSTFRFDDPEQYVGDLLAAELAELGYESFENTPDGLKAYIQADKYDKAKLDIFIKEFGYAPDLSCSSEEAEDKDWNEEWEKHYFEPIVIDDECIVHSTFHKDVPQLKYNIIIDPRMAFGTGHHETTSLIISEILKNDFNKKRVLDMGCGTSVLAILAAKRGAAQLTAIDIDDWCVRNSLENIALNNTKGIDVELGNASLLQGREFDVVLANINRNILLADMEQYAACLAAGGELYISGFYTEDIDVLEQEAARHKLRTLYSRNKNNWAMVKLIKE